MRIGENVYQCGQGHGQKYPDQSPNATPEQNPDDRRNRAEADPPSDNPGN